MVKKDILKKSIPQKFSVVLREMNYNIIDSTLMANGMDVELLNQAHYQRAIAQNKKVILSPKKCIRGKKG